MPHQPALLPTLATAFALAFPFGIAAGRPRLAPPVGGLPGERTVQAQAPAPSGGEA